MRRTLVLTAVASLLLVGCSTGDPTTPEPTETTADQSPTQITPEPTPATRTPETQEPDPTEPAVTEFEATEHDQFDAPWALEFIPGSDVLLITERGGAVKLRDQSSGEVRELSGVPEVISAGQGGLHDLILGPSFEEDQTIYLSWVRSAEGGSHGVVGRAQVDLDTASLENLEVIWEQDPSTGDGHFSLRMLVIDDVLYVTSGDRQQMSPAQDMGSNLGTIVRLDLDGEPMPGNPFEAEGGVAAQFWSTGHRNPLGIATDSQGNLWSSEMGPQGGDELNLILEGANYGWPEVSMGIHYDGTDIPDHAPGDGFEAPKAYWVPAISPGSLMIYQGDLFTGWQDSALLGGLSGNNLVRVELDGESATPADEWEMGDRIRAVEEAPDGAIWIATDSGSLIELRPA